MRQETVVAIIGSFVLAVLFSHLTGCVPLITGLKHVRTSSGAEYDFVTGFDVGAGANAVDSVNNKRGISPKN